MRIHTTLASISPAGHILDDFASQDTERIVGGRNVTILQYPWQVSLFNASSGRHFCGGTILDRSTILTAAHCIRENRPVGVRVGTTFRDRGGYTHTVNRIAVHINFNRTTVDFDIALIVLDRPLVFSINVQPATLPEFDYDLASNTTVWVSGWGYAFPGQTPPEHLQAVDVQTVEQQLCVDAYRVENLTITDNMFCAGAYGVGGRDSCQVSFDCF